MLVNGKALIELNEGKREILHSALEILSPDSTEASERLETLTQTVLDSMLEPGDFEIAFEKEDLELAIAALDVVQPDEFEMEDFAAELADDLREKHRELEGDSPEM